MVGARDIEIHKTALLPSNPHLRVGKQSERFGLLCAYCMPSTRLESVGDMKKEYTPLFRENSVQTWETN